MSWFWPRHLWGRVKEIHLCLCQEDFKISIAINVQVNLLGSVVSTVWEVWVTNSEHDSEQNDDNENCNDGDPEFDVFPEKMLSHPPARLAEWLRL